MSFSSDIRQEVCNIKIYNKDEILSFLQGVFLFSSKIFMENNNFCFIISTENYIVAKKISYLIKKMFEIPLEIYQKNNYNFGREKLFFLKYNGLKVKNILLEIGIIKENNDDFFINENLSWFQEYNENVIKSFFRAVYLVCGSINDPEKNYHLEFSIDTKNKSEFLKKLLNENNLKSNIFKRKDNYIVYIKESESISDFLNLVGAHECMFKFEDIRIKKQMINNVNRIVNCETANLSKIVKTYIRQKKAIEYIITKKGIEFLTPELREIALIRLKFNDISLKELGEKLSIPVSKSGVNYRLKKIEEISNKIYEEELKNDKKRTIN